MKNEFYLESQKIKMFQILALPLINDVILDKMTNFFEANKINNTSQGCSTCIL